MRELLGALAGVELSPVKPRSLFDEDIFPPEFNAEELTAASCRGEGPKAGDGVLRVMGAAELTAANGERFRKQVRAALNGHTSVEIDLSQTTSIDCAGLGALIAIRNQTRLRNGVVRLVNPTTAVQQLLDLMRAEQIFEIANTAI
jgi:anti-anti-sigma factor